VSELAISLHKLGVESYILSPYETNHSLSEGVEVLSTGGKMQDLGLDNYFYKFSKSAYYNRFFVTHFMTDRKFQDKLAKRLAVPIWKTLKEIDVDVVQVEQDAAVPTAIEVKKKTGLPLVADLHNITSEELMAAGVISRGSDVFNKLQLLFAEYIKKVDSVVVVSKEMKTYVSKNYSLSSESIIVVPPGGRVRASTEKSLPLKIIYSGSVSYREHVDLFVRSMPTVRETLRDTEFYITKKGDTLKQVKKLAADLKINPVYFWHDNEEVFHHFLSSCHIGVLPSSNDLARKMGTPVKLFDYLSAGLPVVANNIGAWTDIIREENVGIVTEDNPVSFGSGILKLVENSDLLEDYRQRCLKLVRDKFNWDTSARVLLQAYANQ
jgi:glycosyltransferase involved in cell wall biosynthesis